MKRPSERVQRFAFYIFVGVVCWTASFLLTGQFLLGIGLSLAWALGMGFIAAYQEVREEEKQNQDTARPGSRVPSVLMGTETSIHTDSGHWLCTDQAHDGRPASHPEGPAESNPQSLHR